MVESAWLQFRSAALLPLLVCLAPSPVRACLASELLPRLGRLAGSSSVRPSQLAAATAAVFRPERAAQQQREPKHHQRACGAGNGRGNGSRFATRQSVLCQRCRQNPSACLVLKAQLCRAACQAVRPRTRKRRHKHHQANADHQPEADDRADWRGGGILVEAGNQLGPRLGSGQLDLCQHFSQVPRVDGLQAPPGLVI